MKKDYPNYSKKGVEPVERKLLPKDKTILKDFLTFCRATSNEYKVKCRRSELLQVRDIIEKEFDKWTLEDLRGFLAVLNSSSRAIWTKKCQLITLGMFLRWKFKEWSEKFDELKDLKKLNRQLVPDNEEKYKELPTAEEIDKLIRKATNPRDKLYISMCSEAGLPPAVQLNLKWQDIEIDKPQENISTLQYHRGKNNTTFIFPLGKTTTYYLKQWKQEFCYQDLRKDDFIFPNPTTRDKPMSVVTMWHLFKRLSKKAEIDKNLYQYKLRHKTLSDNYDIFPEEVHRRLYGHVKGSTQTKTYSHKKEKEKTLAIALEKLHKVEEITKEQQNKYDKQITAQDKKINRILLEHKDLLKKHLKLVNLINKLK